MSLTRPASSSIDLLVQGDDGFFDYRHAPPFAEKYLHAFYGDREPTNDERAVFRFLASHVGRLRNQPVLLEVGCGPTVHHILPFAHRVSEIHMADYLDENLAEVRKWKEGAREASRWSQYSELTLVLQGAEPRFEAVRSLERLARTKLKDLLPCDLRDDFILGAPAAYAAVTAFYCTEEIGVTTAAWEHVMENLARVVAPGGDLFLSCLLDTDSYVVGDTVYPCARITEEDVRRVLPALGFDMSQTVVTSVAVDGQAHEGVVGVVLAAARKLTA